MTISANQLTLARIALLPIPLAILYHGGVTWTLAALVVLVALGLTDILDGPLARRKPPTRLGHVLDGISDRVFVIVLYTVLSDLRIVSTVALAVVAGRELFVVGLRGLTPETATVGRSGRLKMTVQMGGAGYLLLMWFLPAPWIQAVFIVSAMVWCALLVTSYRRTGRRDWRAMWGTLLSFMLMAACVALPARDAMALLVGIILSITIISAVMFAWSVREEASGKLRRNPGLWFGLMVSTLATPMIWIPLVGVDRLLTVVVAGACAAELTLLSLRAAGASALSSWDTTRDIAIALGIAVAGLTIRALLLRDAEDMTVRWFAGGVLVMILGGTIAVTARALRRLASQELVPAAQFQLERRVNAMR